jgi:chemotaxis methyl-accepting protein methylase
MTWSLKQPSKLPEKQSFLWEKLLEQRTGVQLTDSQQTLLHSQVAVRMRELDIDSYDDYFDYVQGDYRGGAEWQLLVDRLVVKETTFFRHRPSLDLVNQYIHNKLTRNSERENGHNNIEIWSVGCSTGEEAYALAAVANDCFKFAGIHPYFGVTAVDISLPSLSIAREGIYGRRSIHLLTQEESNRYFEPCGENFLQVTENLKKRVCFSQLNILELKEKPVQLMDVIFCQNVLIYFKRWRRKNILNELVKHLKPGGVLVIGLGEITDWQHPEMERIANEEVQAYVKFS